jgi:NO-binding membrane sensor protein with MHYT domain
MHFVGMSAITLTDPYGETINISYRLDLTFLSLISVVLLCYVGFYLSSRDGIYLSDTVDKVDEFIRGARKMSISELKAMHHKSHVLFMTLFKRMDSIVAGGTTMAAGVCVMHYIGKTVTMTLVAACIYSCNKLTLLPHICLGMESMMIEHCKMNWNIGLVAASVVIAVLASTAAFWILFRLLALYPHYEVLRIVGAVVASIAVNGMHYTGDGATFVAIIAYEMSLLAAL